MGVLIPVGTIGVASAVILPFALKETQTSHTTITLKDGQQSQWKNPEGGAISIEFNLSKELGADEELFGPTFPEDSGLSLHNAMFDEDATWEVQGTKAVATVKFKDFSSGSYITADKINFNVRNKKTKHVLSKATLTNFKVEWE